MTALPTTSTTSEPRGDTNNLRDLIRERPMSRAQILAVTLCTLINMVDGFDILAAAVAAPAIARDWMLQPLQLGLLFSAGLAGMTIGALALSPLADRWGRRRTVLLALVLVTVGMFSCALATTLPPLIAARLLTGIGVGAVMPAINTVVSEFSNRRTHDFAVCLQSAGFPLGGALAGASAYLLIELDWRWIFVAGGCFSLLLIPAVMAWMPESLEFLIERRPRGALERLNLLLTRFGLPRVAELPGASRQNADATHTRLRDLAPNTLLICSSFFALMFTFYFVSNWTPKLLIDYGLSTRVGVSGALLMNVGGFLGDVAFAILVLRWPACRVGPIFMALCFATLAAFAFVPTRLETLLPIALLLGFLLFGSMCSLYAIVPTLYPATLRTTGTGMALGLGRIGATIGPYVGGLLIAMAWSRATYLTVMALPLLVCAALTWWLSRRMQNAQASVLDTRWKRRVTHDAAA